MDQTVAIPLQVKQAKVMRQHRLSQMLILLPQDRHLGHSSSLCQQTPMRFSLVQEFPASHLLGYSRIPSSVFGSLGILWLRQSCGNIGTKPHLQQFVTDMLASCSVTLWTCEVQGCMKLESNGESMAELFSRPCKDKAETRHYATSKVKAFTTNLYRNSF